MGYAISAPVASVIAAVFGLLGAVAGAYVKGFYDERSQVAVEERRVQGALELEDRKFQAELILKGIDTDEQNTAVRTLKFFANAGLIPKYAESILAIAEADEGSAVPTLRPPSPYRPLAELAESSAAAAVGRAVGLFMVGDSGRCTAFVTQGNNEAILPTFCLPQDRDLTKLHLRLGYDSEEAIVRDISIASIEEADPGGLAVLRLAVGENERLQGLSLRKRIVAPAEPVYMVHHPKVGPKQLSDECYIDPESPISDYHGISGVREGPLLNFRCRSDGGSAGAPVIAVRDGALLGVHVAGKMGFEQMAIPIDSFLAVSATAR